MIQDYEYLAKSLASLSGLPVRYYIGGKFAGLFHHTKFKPDLAIMEEENIFADNKNVSYYMDENLLCYGLFRAKEDDVSLVIGPVTPMQIDSSSISKILRKIGEPLSRSAELTAYFSTIPSYPLRNFLQILCTVNYFLNHEKTDVGDIIIGKEIEENITEDIAEDITEDIAEDITVREKIKNTPMPTTHNEPVINNKAVIHNTMELEQEMLSYVEYGRTKQLKKLYKSPIEGRAGKMAPDAIRQQKNLLVCTATLVTRAAIKGGLDSETAFGLSDLYIQQSELLNDYVELSRLNAKMVMDFTRRVEAICNGKIISKLTINVRNYILEHISEPITTQQIAEALDINRTYLCKLFNEQNKVTINRYITEIKTEEAKRLLKATDKSLADIAFYLGFSSQSHFQNTFHKQCGITPKCFREDDGKK